MPPSPAWLRYRHKSFFDKTVVIQRADAPVNVGRITWSGIRHLHGTISTELMETFYCIPASNPLNLTVQVEDHRHQPLGSFKPVYGYDFVFTGYADPPLRLRHPVLGDLNWSWRFDASSPAVITYPVSRRTVIVHPEAARWLHNPVFYALLGIYIIYYYRKCYANR